jgi:hypothetical protein
MLKKDASVSAQNCRSILYSAQFCHYCFRLDFFFIWDENFCRLGTRNKQDTSILPDCTIVCSR